MFDLLRAHFKRDIELRAVCTLRGGGRCHAPYRERKKRGMGAQKLMHKRSTNLDDLMVRGELTSSLD